MIASMRVPYRFPVTPGLEAGLVVAWSSGFIGGSLASMTSSVFLVLFWRFLLAGLLLMVLAAPQLRRMTLSQVGRQGLIGAFAMFGFLATVIAAIDLGVPPGTAALVTALQPLATAALAGHFLGECTSGKQWTGLAIGLVGVAVTVAGALDRAPLRGYALALLSTAAIVTATLAAKAQTHPVPLLPALAIQCVTSAILFFPLAALDGGITPEMTQPFAYAVGWFILLSTFAGYGLYWACLARTSATRVASLIYLTPPVTTVWAFLMFGEPITLTAVAGLLLSMTGVWLARGNRGVGTCRG